MPISKRWSKMHASNVQDKVPVKAGVYELKNFGKLVYIGKASNLQERMAEHNRERDPNYFRFKTAGFLGSHHRMERRHIQKYENQNGKLPSWNQRRP